MTDTTPPLDLAELRQMARSPQHYSNYTLASALHTALDRLDVAEAERDAAAADYSRACRRSDRWKLIASRFRDRAQAVEAERDTAQAALREVLELPESDRQALQDYAAFRKERAARERAEAKARSLENGITALGQSVHMYGRWDANKSRRIRKLERRWIAAWKRAQAAEVRADRLDRAVTTLIAVAAHRPECSARYQLGCSCGLARVIETINEARVPHE